MFRRISLSHPPRPTEHWWVVLAVVVATLVALLLAASSAGAADLLELNTGAKVQGQILSRTAKAVTMNVVVSGVTLKRSYPLASIRAITTGGKREVVAAPADSAPTASKKTAKASAGKSAGGPRSELDALIDKVGRTPPDWYETTPLNYPQTLDLDWPEPAPGGWNNQKNMGQFMWDVVNPNPGRWKEGTKLVHHLLEKHQGNPPVLKRSMEKLGHMYHDLLEDYPRSAFWLRAVGVEKNPRSYLRETPLLAECYWRMGYRDEALKLLAKAQPSFFQVKLLADMGETDRAVKICESSVKSAPEHAYLYAGDACLVAGRYRQALGYYQKVLGVEASGKQAGRVKRFHDRANANVVAIKYFELFDLAKVPDGTYQAASQGYEGPVEISVTVASGSIGSVKVTDHKEKQFYSAISDTPQKIIAKQSVKGIDTTSAATITSEAIVNATAKALGQAAE